MPVRRHDEAVIQGTILTQSGHGGLAGRAQGASVLDQEGKGKEEYDGTQFGFHHESL